MLNLDDKTWKPFFIGDIFTVKRPKARSEKDYKDGKSPFVASGNFNNGVIRCCEPHADETLDKGNCITVSPVDGSAFYQQSDFLGRGGAGSSVLLLYCEHINKYSGLFLARLIRQTCSKYCYGKMGNQDGIKREKILLPITYDGQPDYSFMEQYIRERENKLKQKYIDFIGDNYDIGGLPSLEEKTWKAFYIGDIFDTFIPGKSKGLNHLKREENGIPYLGATNSNNGVMCFVEDNNKLKQHGNAIGFIKNGNGSAGYSIYKKEDFIATSDIIFAYAEWLTPYIGLFITTTSDMSQEKYSHGYKWTRERLIKSTIMLPATDEGSPDYEYMEQYIKAVMFGKYKKYLEYVQK